MHCTDNLVSQKGREREVTPLLLLQAASCQTDGAKVTHQTKTFALIVNRTCLHQSISVLKKEIEMFEKFLCKKVNSQKYRFCLAVGTYLHELMK